VQVDSRLGGALSDLDSGWQTPSENWFGKVASRARGKSWARRGVRGHTLPMERVSVVSGFVHVFIRRLC